METLVVHRGTLYASRVWRAGGRNRFGGLVAFDVATGKVRWAHTENTTIDDMRMHRGRLIVAGQMRVLGGARRENLAAIDLPTGRVLPHFRPRIAGITDYVASEPYVAALAKRGRELYAAGSFLEVDGRPQVGLVALDARTGRRRSTLAGASGRVLVARARGHDALRRRRVPGPRRGARALLPRGDRPAQRARDGVGPRPQRRRRRARSRPRHPLRRRQLRPDRGRRRSGPGGLRRAHGRAVHPLPAAGTAGPSRRSPSTAAEASGPPASSGSLPNGERIGRGASRRGRAAYGRCAGRRGIRVRRRQARSHGRRGRHLQPDRRPRERLASRRSRARPSRPSTRVRAAAGPWALAPLPGGGLLAGGEFNGMDMRATGGLARFRGR